jgi:hypothetical protein
MIEFPITETMFDFETLIGEEDPHDTELPEIEEFSEPIRAMLGIYQVPVSELDLTEISEQLEACMAAYPLPPVQPRS